MNKHPLKTERFVAWEDGGHHWTCGRKILDHSPRASRRETEQTLQKARAHGAVIYDWRAGSPAS